MRGNGLITKRMGSESIYYQTAHFTRAFGKTICRMGRGKRSILMGELIRDPMFLERRKEGEYLGGLRAKSTAGISIVMSSMERGGTSGARTITTMVSG